MWAHAGAEQLKALSDELGNPIFILQVGDQSDPDLLCVNARFEELAGIATQPGATLRLRELMSEEQAVVVAAHCRACVSLGERREFQQRLDFENGSYWWHVTLSPIRDANGRIVRLLGSATDITGQHTMQAALQENSNLLQLFFRQSLDGFFFMMLDEPVRWDESVDKDAVLDYVFSHQRMTKVNDALLAQYRLTEEAVLGMTPADFFAHDLQQGRSVWRAFFDAGRLHVSTEERRADGEPVWIEGDYICIRDSDDRIAGHFGVQRDVTQAVEVERQLLASERRLRLITDNLPALISHVGADLKFQFNNRMYRDWLGIEPESLVGQGVGVINRYVDQPLRRYRQQVLRGERVTFEVTGHLIEGDRFLQVTYVPDRNEAGEVEGFYSLCVDISDRRQREMLLERQASEDGLTGLLNRRGLMERLQRALARAARHGESLALLFIDLDDFKRINDSFGHDAGDVLIRDFASRLREVVRSTDSLARLAGDEFVILLESLEDPHEDAVRVARKVLHAMAEPLWLGDRTVDMSTSIGIALNCGGVRDASLMLRTADGAMYRAKREGKNAYWFAGNDDQGAPDTPC